MKAKIIISISLVALVLLGFAVSVWYGSSRYVSDERSAENKSLVYVNPDDGSLYLSLYRLSGWEYYRFVENPSGAEEVSDLPHNAVPALPHEILKVCANCATNEVSILKIMKKPIPTYENVFFHTADLDIYQLLVSGDLIYIGWTYGTRTSTDHKFLYEVKEIDRSVSYQKALERDVEKD